MTAPFTEWFQPSNREEQRNLSSPFYSQLQVVVYELFKFGLLGSQRGPRLACLRARGGVGFRPATPRREFRARRTDGRRRLHSLRERQLHEDAPEVKNNKKSTHLKWILPPQGGS